MESGESGGGQGTSSDRDCHLCAQLGFPSSVARTKGVWSRRAHVDGHWAAERGQPPAYRWTNPNTSRIPALRALFFRAFPGAKEVARLPKGERRHFLFGTVPSEVAKRDGGFRVPFPPPPRPPQQRPVKCEAEPEERDGGVADGGASGPEKRKLGEAVAEDGPPPKRPSPEAPSPRPQTAATDFQDGPVNAAQPTEGSPTSSAQANCAALPKLEEEEEPEEVDDKAEPACLAPEGLQPQAPGEESKADESPDELAVNIAREEQESPEHRGTKLEEPDEDLASATDLPSEATQMASETESPGALDGADKSCPEAGEKDADDADDFVAPIAGSLEAEPEPTSAEAEEASELSKLSLETRDTAAEQIDECTAADSEKRRLDPPGKALRSTWPEAVSEASHDASADTGAAVAATEAGSGAAGGSGASSAASALGDLLRRAEGRGPLERCERCGRQVSARRQGPHAMRHYGAGASAFACPACPFASDRRSLAKPHAARAHHPPVKLRFNGKLWRFAIKHCFPKSARAEGRRIDRSELSSEKSQSSLLKAKPEEDIRGERNGVPNESTEPLATTEDEPLVPKQAERVPGQEKIGPEIVVKQRSYYYQGLCGKCERLVGACNQATHVLRHFPSLAFRCVGCDFASVTWHTSLRHSALCGGAEISYDKAAVADAVRQCFPRAQRVRLNLGKRPLPEDQLSKGYLSGCRNCAECGHRVKSHRQEPHALSRHSELAYGCGSCGRSFFVKAAIIHHVLQKCPDAELRFDSHAIEQAVRACFPPQKPIVIGSLHSKAQREAETAKTMVSLSHLKTGGRKLLPEALLSKSYLSGCRNCAECGRRVKSDRLERHALSRHSELAYGCGSCGRSFFVKTTIIQHVLQKCPGAELRFDSHAIDQAVRACFQPREPSMSTWLRSKAQREAEAAKTMGSLRPLKTGGRKLLPEALLSKGYLSGCLNCAECGRRVKGRAVEAEARRLTRHVLEAHWGHSAPPAFRCSHCGATQRSHGELRRHLALAHDAPPPPLTEEQSRLRALLRAAFDPTKVVGPAPIAPPLKAPEETEARVETPSPPSDKVPADLSPPDASESAEEEMNDEAEAEKAERSSWDGAVGDADEAADRGLCGDDSEASEGKEEDNGAAPLEVSSSGAEEEEEEEERAEDGSWEAAEEVEDESPQGPALPGPDDDPLSSSDDEAHTLSHHNATTASSDDVAGTARLDIRRNFAQPKLTQPTHPIPT